MTTLQDAADASMLEELTTLRPESEYHEDMGPVLWWKVPIQEPPWIGTTNDLGREVLVDTGVYVQRNGKTIRMRDGTLRLDVGGWVPGYYTHWSPLPKVQEPK